jgi:protein-disulfide isomerase
MGSPSRDLPPARVALASAMTLIPSIAGAAASALLLYEYLQPAPVFCGEGGGCAALKQTALASVLGVPTPAIGLVGFVVLGGLALGRGRATRRLALFLASAAALVGAGLLVAQAVIGTFCRFCVVADLAAVLALATEVMRRRGQWSGPQGVRGRALGAVSMAAAVALPFALAALRPPAVPPAPPPGVPLVVAREMEQTPAGLATVIDFVDFECPFCRATHAELEPVIEEHRAEVRVVRKHVPLTQIHPRALDAARAACCGETLGRGDAMADALFRTDDLSPAGCERIAETLGLDVTEYRRCLTHPVTTSRIEADVQTFEDAHGHGLPTLWIGTEKLEGAQPRDTLRRAVTEAIARARS